MPIVRAATGIQFDVEQRGRGRELVLFHSLLTDRTAFDAVVPTLAGHRRLTLVNLPGFGESSPAGPAIEDYADRLAHTPPIEKPDEFVRVIAPFLPVPL